jgi:polyphosphate kinase 2
MAETQAASGSRRAIVSVRSLRTFTQQGTPVSKHHARIHRVKGLPDTPPGPRVDPTEIDVGRGAPYQQVTDRRDYKAQLHKLQIELVKLQRHFIARGEKILVLFEGRDAAGKDGCIKRITQYLSPRETRVVAMSKPSDHERDGWYFQRYVAHLPYPEELVLFNRSWYNRAGVEHVMDYCTDKQYVEFMESVPKFEETLVGSGIRLLKYYLDIGRKEQKKRLAKRRNDPLKQWKASPVDAVALKKWKAYSTARNAMLLQTHTKVAPWRIVKADDKIAARLNIIRDILSQLPYAGKDHELLEVDSAVVFPYSPQCVESGRLEP